MITVSISLGLFITIVVVVAFGAACFGTWASFSHERASIKRREQAAARVEQDAHQLREQTRELQEANIAHSFVLDEREAAVEEKELQLREAASGMRAQMKLALNQSLDDTVIMELPNWEEVPNGSS